MKSWSVVELCILIWIPLEEAEVVIIVLHKVHLFIFQGRLLDHLVLGTRLLSGGGEKRSSLKFVHFGCLIFTAKLIQVFSELLEIQSSSLMNCQKFSVFELLESLKLGLIYLPFVPFVHLSILFPKFVLLINFKVEDGEVAFNTLLVLFLCLLHEISDMRLELQIKSILLLESWGLALWNCRLGKLILGVIFQDRLQLELWLHALSLIAVLKESMILRHILYS